jgi:hypothetical protein
MTTITWTVERMWVKPAEGPFTNVVITAAWNCVGIDGQYMAAVCDRTSFAQPDNDFTPYDQLTEGQVLGWVWTSGVDKLAVEATVQQSINMQAAPPVTTPPLPWAA